MTLEINPGVAPFAAVVFSNDAGTKFEVVCPADPLPVTGTFTPSGTQDENLKQVNGITVLTGAGATGTGSQRVTVAQDSTTVAGSSSLPAGSNVIGHVIVDGETPIKSTVLTPTQVTVPATANGILVLAANANRLGAIITNSGSASVFYSSAATGLTITNGGELRAGSALNIDEPLYTGAIYGIVATGTQVVTVVEFT